MPVSNSDAYGDIVTFFPDILSITSAIFVRRSIRTFLSGPGPMSDQTGSNRFSESLVTLILNPDLTCNRIRTGTLPSTSYRRWTTPVLKHYDVRA